MPFPYRPWWPTIALLVLGTASVLLLQSVHSRSRALLEQTIVALDNVGDSRQRLLHAYLIHERSTAGDATFAQSSPLAELRAAEYALQNWIAGRSSIVNFHGTAPADSAVLALLDSYRASLNAFGDVLATAPRQDVTVRVLFSEAELAAAALEAAIHETVSAALRAEQRAFNLELGGWGLLLLLSLVAAIYGRRALRSSEHRTRETEQRLSHLRTVAPVGIAECSPDGAVRSVNPEWVRLTGVSAADCINGFWWDALAEPFRERAQALWTAPDRDAAKATEARLGDGGDPETGTWALVRLGAEESVRGVRGRAVTLTDITQQRITEEQLHHAQRLEAVGRLAGGAAHDFNNLLTSIGGFASLARDQIHDPEVAQDLSEIERAVARGQALTRQLLTFSRRNRAHPGLVDTAAVVRELRRMLERLVPDDVIIETFIESTPPVFADPTQIEQMITNLVINAADAMEGQGRIDIRVETRTLDARGDVSANGIASGRYIMLSVSDTGPGIPEAIRDRIFEPFFTTKARGKGTGLGLSTVWGIARQIGGHIELLGAEGGGALFRIFLPAAEGVASSTTDETEAPVGASFAGTVLVVDDEDAVRRLTVRVLELSGWSVIEAASGEQALHTMQGRGASIDLLITDVMMRGMNGVDLVSKLRASGSDVPVLFVSGYAGEEPDFGDGVFLAKPFSPPALLQAVDDLMTP
ncbi:MAG: hybrid sensor histidine kinase/response regulator [Longimicrobiales bacterium]